MPTIIVPGVKKNGKSRRLNGFNGSARFSVQSAALPYGCFGSILQSFVDAGSKAIPNHGWRTASPLRPTHRLMTLLVIDRPAESRIP
jgi:hypothetical protein